MNPFRILDPVLDALNQGKFIRTSVAMGLRVLAVLSLILAAFVTIGSLKIAFQIRGAAGTLGGIILAAFVLASAVAQAGIIFYRARSILDLEDSEYKVTAMMSVLWKMSGECLAAGLVLLGAGGFCFALLTESNPAGLMGPLGAIIPNLNATGFVGAVILLATSVMLAFLAILAFYAMAELTSVLVDIAVNTRAVRASLAPLPATAAAPRAMAAAAGASASRMPPPVAFAGQPSKCPQCGNGIDATAVFCGVCGTSVRGA